MRRALYYTLLIIFIAVFLVSGYFLLDYFLASREASSAYDELSQQVEQARQDVPVLESNDKDAVLDFISGINDSSVLEHDDGSNTHAPELVTVTDPETGEEVSILPEYADLYLENNDLVGWIQIPGTNIDHPVMQTPNAKDYYLYLNFEEEYSNHGSIYAREQCDFQKPSDNVTIYGHNMKDKTMFAHLLNYEDPEFLKDHPYIRLDTLTGRYVYEIICVFKTTASIGEGFDYHLFVDAQNESEFDQYIADCKALGLYDIDESAQYGDKLICLSTCEYTLVNGRMVVLAKRLNP